MLDYIRELSQDNLYDRIVWDTAPLGQTLGLLRTPGMLREHLRPAPRIYSRLRMGDQTRKPILEIIRGWEALSQHNMAFIQNDVAIVLVVIPEALAVRQLERILGELKNYGLSVRQLIVNEVVVSPDSDFLNRKSKQQQKYRQFLHKSYGTMKISEVPLFPQEVKGLPRLNEVCSVLFD
jgi:arsenite-transporting ATPase